jgi:kexin
LFDDYHGTRCAGEIAAISNDMCGVGVAQKAKVAGELSYIVSCLASVLTTALTGIRMLSAEIDSVSEVEALNYHFHENHIYSCSWGPPDDGAAAEGPDALIEHGFVKGVEKGRSGLGSIFVFASGNGGRNMDNCNFDGYTNSIYTTTIGAIDRMNIMPEYAELCAAQLMVTYSSGSGSSIVSGPPFSLFRLC